MTIKKEKPSKESTKEQKDFTSVVSAPTSTNEPRMYGYDKKKEKPSYIPDGWHVDNPITGQDNIIYPRMSELTTEFVIFGRYNGKIPGKYGDNHCILVEGEGEYRIPTSKILDDLLDPLKSGLMSDWINEGLFQNKTSPGSHRRWTRILPDST